MSAKCKIDIPAQAGLFSDSRWSLVLSIDHSDIVVDCGLAAANLNVLSSLASQVPSIIYDTIRDLRQAGYGHKVL